MVRLKAILGKDVRYLNGALWQSYVAWGGHICSMYVCMCRVLYGAEQTSHYYEIVS